MPWLYYGDQPGLASRVLQTQPLPIGYSFRGTYQVRVLVLHTSASTAKGAVFTLLPTCNIYVFMCVCVCVCLLSL